MLRKFGILFAVLTALAGCMDTGEVQLGPDGRPLPRVYRMPSDNRVQYQMLDSVNLLREAAGLGPVELNSELTAAAATHSRDMHVQNRPWHFGSDGSSPLDRVARVGYPGVMLGENISETYETELETLAAWMEDEGTRFVLLHPEATEMGFSWFQENNGKIWWTLIMGDPSEAPMLPTEELQG